MVKHKLKESVTLEELAIKIVADMKNWTPDQKAHLRAKLKRELFQSVERKITYKM
jgi:hypothetical protein